MNAAWNKARGAARNYAQRHPIIHRQINGFIRPSWATAFTLHLSMFMMFFWHETLRRPRKPRTLLFNACWGMHGIEQHAEGVMMKKKQRLMQESWLRSSINNFHGDAIRATTDRGLL